MKKERSLTAFKVFKHKSTVFFSSLVLLLFPLDGFSSGSPLTSQEGITAASCEQYVLGLDDKQGTEANIFINFEDSEEDIEIKLKEGAHKSIRLVAYFQNNFKGAVEEFHLFSIVGSSPFKSFISPKFSVPKNMGTCRFLSFPIHFSSPELVLTLNILKPNDFDPKSVEFLKTKNMRLIL